MKKILIAIVKLYKFLISPILPGSCRFVPSCSEYSLVALEKYGAVKGVWLSMRRVARCHPFHPGGYDPVK
jgi:putative membrane protein insertion efficiency factor